MFLRANISSIINAWFITFSIFAKEYMYFVSFDVQSTNSRLVDINNACLWNK